MTFTRRMIREMRRANGEKQPKVLEDFNDKRKANETYLHPTKGWRFMSEKRSRAALLTQELKRGATPYNFAFMKKVMTNG